MPMLLLGFLWLLRASPGEAGTPSMTTATSSSHLPGVEAASTAPRSTLRTGGAPQWLLSPHQSPNSAPNNGEHTPRTDGMPSNFKLTYESLLSSPVSPDTMTALMSKFVIKVETSPPTVLVYMPTTECIQPSGFTITTTHPTTTCVTTTYVPFTSSYTTTPMTDKPMTTITAMTPLTSVGKVTSSVTSASTVADVGGTPTITSPPSSVSTTYPAQGTLTSSTTGTTEMITMTPTDVHTTLPLTPGVTYLSATAPSQIPTKTSLTTVTDNIAPPSTSFLITAGIITKPFPTASNSLKTETSSTRSLGSINKSTSIASVAKETTSHSGEPSVGMTLMNSGRTTHKPISDTPSTASSYTTTPTSSSTSMVTISTSNMATSMTNSHVTSPPSTFLPSDSSDIDSTFRTPIPGAISVPSPSGLEGTSQTTDIPISHGPDILTTISAAASHLPTGSPGFMATMTSLGSTPYVTLISETLSPSKDIQTLTTTSLTTLSMGNTVPWGTMTDFTSAHEAPSMPATHTNFISSDSSTKTTDTLLSKSHPSTYSVLPTLLNTGSAENTSTLNTSVPLTSVFSPSILPDSSGTTQMDSVPSAPTITQTVHTTAESTRAHTTLTTLIAPTSAEPRPTSAVTGAGQPPFLSHASTVTGDITLNPTTDLPTESPLTEITVTSPTSFSVAPTDVWLSERSSMSSPMTPNMMTLSTSSILSSTPAPDTQSVTTGMTNTTPLSTSTTVLSPTQATSTAVSQVNSPGFPNSTVGYNKPDITSPTTTTNTLTPDTSVIPTWTSWPTSEASRTAITHSVTTATLVTSHSTPSLTTSDSRSTHRESTVASTSHPNSPGTIETLTSVPTSSPSAGLATISATHLPSSSSGNSGSSVVTPTSTHAHPSMSTTHTSITPSSLLVNSTEITPPGSTAHTTTPSTTAAFTTTGNTQPHSLPVSVPALTLSTSMADVSFGNTQTGSMTLSKPQTLHTTTESTPIPTSTASTEPLLTTATLIPTTDLPPESVLTGIAATSQIMSPATPSDPAVSTKVVTSPAALSSVSISSTQPVTTDVPHTAPLSTLEMASPTSRALSMGTSQATDFSSLTNAVTVLTLEMSSPSSFRDTLAPDTSLMSTWPSLPTSEAARTSTTHLVTTATQTPSLVTSSSTTPNIYSTDRISTTSSTSVLRDTVTTIAMASPTMDVSAIPTTALITSSTSNTVPLVATDISPTHEGSITSASHTTLPPFLSSPQNLETTQFITSARTTPSRTAMPSGTENHSSTFATSLPVTSASSLSLSAGRTGSSQTGSVPSAPTFPHSLDTTVDSTATPVTTNMLTTASSTEPPSTTTSMTRTFFTTIMAPTREATMTSTTDISTQSPVSEVTTSTPSSPLFTSLDPLTSRILTTSTSPTAHVSLSHTSRVPSSTLVPSSQPVTADGTHTLPLSTSPTYTTDTSDASSTARPSQLTSETGKPATTHMAALTPSLRPPTLTDLESFLTDRTSAVSSFPSTHLHTTTATSLTPTSINDEPLVTTTGGTYTLPVSSTLPAHSALSLSSSILPSTEAQLVSTQHTTPTSTTDNPSSTGNPTSPNATRTPVMAIFSSSISASSTAVTWTGSWPSAPVTNHTLRTTVELTPTLRATTTLTSPTESSPLITSQQSSPNPAVTSTGNTTLKPTTDPLTESLKTQGAGTPMDTSSITLTGTLASGTPIPSVVTSSVLTSTTNRVLPSVSGSSTKPVPAGTTHSTPLSASETTLPVINATSAVTPQVTFPSSVTSSVIQSLSYVTSPTSILATGTPDASATPTWPSLLTSETSHTVTTQMVTVATLPPSLSTPSLTSLNGHSTVSLSSTAISVPPATSRATGTLTPTMPPSPSSGLPTVTDTALTSSSMGSTTKSLMTDTAVTSPIMSSVTVTGPLSYGRSTSPSHSSSNVLTSGTSLALSSMSVSSSQQDATVSASRSPLSAVVTSLPNTNVASKATPQVPFLSSTTYSMADNISVSVTDTSTLTTFLTPTQPSPLTSGTTSTVTPDLYTNVTLTPSPPNSTQSPDSTTATTTLSHPTTSGHLETLTSLTSSLPSEGIPTTFNTGFPSSTGNSGTSAMTATTSTYTSSSILPTYTSIIPPSSITQNTGISHLSTSHSIAPIVTTTVTVTRDTPTGSLGTSMSVSPEIPLSRSTSIASVPTGASPTSPDYSFSSFYTQSPSPNFSPILSESHVPSTSTAPSTLKTLVSTPTSLTTLTSLGEPRTNSLPWGSTSTNALVTAFATLISSTPTVIMSASPSLPTMRPMLTTTTKPPSPSSLNSSTAAAATSAATSFPPSSTTRISPITSPLTTAHTESTPFSYISLPSTTPCPEIITITIVPSSPLTPCVDINATTGAPSAPITPFSVIPSTTNMVTSSSSISERTFLPTHLNISSMTPETEPSDTITDAPSSTNTRTIVTDTVFRSTSMSTRDIWLSATSITTPNKPGSVNVPSTMKPSNSFPTTTSSKVIYPVLSTTKTPETSVATVTSPTTLTSPQSRPTSTSTQMTTAVSLTTTPGVCDNGGIWEQGQCICPPGFSGDHCQDLGSRCQNGGSWDGIRCVCPSTFHGSLCEFPVEQLDIDTVETEVGMEVSVEQEFSPDLKDNTSKAYKDFSSAFQHQMQKIYQTVQGFQGVEILSLRRGSIVVDYQVLLRLSFSPQLKSDFEKVKTALLEELQSASQDSGSCQDNQTLCFKSDSIKVNNRTEKELTPEAICHRAAPKGFEEHYFPLVEPSRFRCVTNCTPGVSGTIDCNQGQCFLQKRGPTCRCFSTDTYWVSGPRCEVVVDWRVLVGGLVGAATVLLLLLVALSVWVAHSRGRDKDSQPSGRSWTQDRKWFEIWDEDSAGTFSNRGFQDALTATNENFHVALEKVDTNMMVHIQRPEVTSSSSSSSSSSPSPSQLSSSMS